MQQHQFNAVGCGLYLPTVDTLILAAVSEKKYKLKRA
jgi:hypothetical protein